MNVSRSSVKPPAISNSNSGVHRASNARRRAALDSAVHVLPEANANRPTPMRPVAPAAPNPFASLEQQATQTYQVSHELLALAREQAAAQRAGESEGEGEGGATKAYEVPAELLEMARAKRMARASRSAAPGAPAVEAEPAAADAGHAPSAKELPRSGPRLSVSEVSDEERAWIDLALQSDASPPAGAESSHLTEEVTHSQIKPVRTSREVAPPRSAPRRARRVLAALAAAFISGALIQGARIVQQRQASSPTAQTSFLQTALEVSREQLARLEQLFK